MITNISKETLVSLGKYLSLLDDESSLTLIEEDTANKLGFKDNIESLWLKCTSDVKRTEHESKMVNLEIAATSRPQRR